MSKSAREKKDAARNVRHVKRDIKLIFSSHVTHVVILLLILFLITPFLIALSLNLHPAKNISYGVTYSPMYARELGLDWQKVYLAILDELKVNHIRLAGYWDQIEKEPGRYDLSEITWELDRARERNVSVIYSLGRKVPRWPECYEPSWIEHASTEDANTALLKFITEEVNSLKSYDNIKMWQVENEPYFPFGDCRIPTLDFLKKEVALVRSLDEKKRPVIIQDSGEGGVWFLTYAAGDFLGISMYRRIQYDFWGIFLGRKIFFTYPLSYWSYPLKARLTQVPADKIQVLELQAEPWGVKPIPQMSLEEKDKTMSKDKFLETLSYAQKTGFNSFYLWGAEWWYYEKTKNDNPFFWETAKALWK